MMKRKTRPVLNDGFDDLMTEALGIIGPDAVIVREPSGWAVMADGAMRKKVLGRGKTPREALDVACTCCMGPRHTDDCNLKVFKKE